MKIAHVCARYAPFFGGVELHVQKVAENLVARGHEVCVFSTDPTEKLEKVSTINGVKIYRVKAFAPQESYYFSVDLYKILKNIKVDLIHGHGLQCFPLFLASLVKGPHFFVATLHSGGTSSPLRRLLRFPYERLILHNALKKAEKIICVSEYELERYPRILRLNPDKFVCIPNGTDITDANCAHHTKDKVDPRKHEHNILAVGRLEKWKGFDVAIKSLAILKRKKGVDDPKLVIVGKGPSKQELVWLANKAGVSSDVIFAEDVPRKELIDLYHRCDVFVHLCDHGYPGISALEAIALQKPVIIPKLGIMKSYIEKGFCLGVDSPPNPFEVAEKLRSVLENPNSFKPAKMQVFSWNEVTERIVTLYEEVSQHLCNQSMKT